MILVLFIIIIIGLVFIFLSVDFFVKRFKNQGEPASLLTKQEIEQWKNRGLTGEKAGQAYNNGWINPENPKIVYGKITFYSNYQQHDGNFNPVEISKFELDRCYKLLFDITHDNSSSLNYTKQINKLDYYKLPSKRQRNNLLSIQNERKYDLILRNIQQAETVKEVKKESFNIEQLEDYYLPYGKSKIILIKIKNKRIDELLDKSLNEEQRKVYNLVIQKKNIFFTGSAGTGKSFLLQRIIHYLEKTQGKNKIAVTAPTGIAALNIGGVTIHSFSGIGIDNEATAQALVKKIERYGKANWVKNWKTINALIIDEISMLSGKNFDKLEYIARQIRQNNLPFGGLQLILAGDFFQLLPINSNNCFEAEKWKDCLQHTIQLTKIYRQEEAELIDLLNELRFGEVSDKSREILKRLEEKPNWPDDGIKPTQLMATNREIEVINNQELDKINSPPQIYQAKDFEHKKNSNYLTTLKKSCLARDVLKIKIGSQVMLIKNLSEKLVNGRQGIVVGFRRSSIPDSQRHVKNKLVPVVKFTNGIEEVIQETDWTFEEPITYLTLASRIQIPLILSWAITIHKSQGQSIERLKVDLKRVTKKGQTYVALSRACSLKYLQVTGFATNKLICDEKVKKFYQELTKV